MNFRAPLLTALLAPFLMASGPAHAVEWYTVTGNKADPEVDTTQLDVSTVQRRGKETALRYRVSLAKPRTMYGVSYQSYISTIVVDCPSRSIFHESQERFPGQHWEGTAVPEKFQQPKPMAFMGLVPDPRPVIFGVTCDSKPIRSQTAAP